MNRQEYNGWTNFETWHVNLHWFDGMSAEDCGFESDCENNDIVIEDLAAFLKDHVESAIDEGGGLDYVKQMAWHWLSQVDWREIAEHMIEK